MIRPEGWTAGKKYPAIVIHGGPQSQQVQNAWCRPTSTLRAPRIPIWQVDNRGSAGRGQMEARIHRNLGAQELKDQLEGLRFRMKGLADMGRVGVHGWSYGGYMTPTPSPTRLMSSARAAEPVTDWLNYDTIYTERYGAADDNADGYRRSSPVTTAANLKASASTTCRTTTSTSPTRCRWGRCRMPEHLETVLCPRGRCREGRV
jgi:dipeptidyl-peptidase-4